MDSRTNRYSYQVQWSDEDNAYIATCAEFPSVSAFADSPPDALAEVMQVIDASIELLEEEGDTPPEPMATRTYSGTLSLRLPPTTHRDAAIAAAHENVSLNQYITSQLERASAMSGVFEELRALHARIDRLERRRRPVQSARVRKMLLTGLRQRHRHQPV